MIEKWGELLVFWFLYRLDKWDLMFLISYKSYSFCILILNYLGNRMFLAD